MFLKFPRIFHHFRNNFHPNLFFFLDETHCIDDDNYIWYSRNTWNYTNFLPSEPDDGPHNCINMHKSAGFGWGDINCGLTDVAFICAKTKRYT